MILKRERAEKKNKRMCLLTSFMAQKSESEEKKSIAQTVSCTHISQYTMTLRKRKEKEKNKGKEKNKEKGKNKEKKKRLLEESFTNNRSVDENSRVIVF